MKKEMRKQAFTKEEKEKGSLIIEICNWMNKNGGNPPNKNSKDAFEKKLGSRIVQLRRVKAGKLPDRKFHKIYDTIAKKFGYPRLFDMRDRQSEVEESVKQIIAWMKKHKGTPPSKKSINMTERKLGEALSALRQSKKKKSKSHRVFYPTLQKMAEDGGFPNLFEITTPAPKMKKKDTPKKKNSMLLHKKEVDVIKSKAVRTIRKPKSIEEETN